MPASPAEWIAVVLLAAALVLVPAALAVALTALARSDRRLPPVPAARRSPRRTARRTVPTDRPTRRFPDR